MGIFGQMPSCPGLFRPVGLSNAITIAKWGKATLQVELGRLRQICRFTEEIQWKQCGTTFDLKNKNHKLFKIIFIIIITCVWTSVGGNTSVYFFEWKCSRIALVTAARIRKIAEQFSPLITKWRLSSFTSTFASTFNTLSMPPAGAVWISSQKSTTNSMPPGAVFPSGSLLT